MLQGYGIATPKGSRWRDRISQAILYLQEKSAIQVDTVAGPDQSKKLFVFRNLTFVCADAVQPVVGQEWQG